MAMETNDTPIPALTGGQYRARAALLALGLCAVPVVSSLLFWLAARCIGPVKANVSLQILLNSLCPLVFGVPAAWMLLRLVPGTAPEKQPVPFGELPKLVCISYAALFLGGVFGNLVSLLLFPKATNPVDLIVSEQTMGVWSVLSLCVLAPFTEELLFRKLLLDRAVPLMGEKHAMLFSGLCFGLFHGNLYQFFYAVLIGIVFSCVYIKTGRYGVCVLLHSVMNLLGGVVPVLAGRITYEELPVGTAIAGYLMLALAVLGVVFFFEERKTVSLSPLPEGCRVRYLYLNAGTALFFAVFAGFTVLTLLV